MALLSSDLSELLTEDNIESLNKADIWTVNDYCSADLMDIKRLTNIKYHILKSILEKIKQRYTLACDQMGFLLDKVMRECKMCPTGIPNLTAALDGGFQTQEIVEFYGETESGKTEMCHLLCGEILSHYEDYNILYIDANYQFDYERVVKYTKAKSGGRISSDADIFKCLSRIELARPNRLSELVHLLNTLVHSDTKNSVKCLIIDSISFIIQEDILEIKTTDLDDGDEVGKFSSLKPIPQIQGGNQSTATENTKKDLIDVYLHEVMRLLTNIAITRNLIVILTNSESQLTFSKSYTNSIDHRLHLSKMPEYSTYYAHEPKSTVCRATILKTIHNISKIGYTIPFKINDDGLQSLTNLAK